MPLKPWNKNGEMKKCVVCNKEFYVPRYRADKAKFCSHECQNHGQYEHIKRVCLGCGKEFLVSNSRANKKFCNEDCRLKYNSEHSRTAKERRIRTKIIHAENRGYRSKYLRQKVLEKYGFKCAKCGYEKYSFNLDVHHIDENANNNSIENLGLLCTFCHKELHYIYGGDYNKFMKGERDDAVITREKEHTKKYPH